MLLSDRRRALIHLCLVGVDTCWITPFVALLLHQQGLESAPLVIFARLAATLVVWITALELLNLLGVDSPRYELTVAGTIIISSLLVVRLWLYTNAPFLDFGWVYNIFNALFNIHQGLRPELVLVLTSLLLWQRAASATSRSLDFFSVGVSFRLGLLLLMLGAGLLSHLSGHDVIPLLWLYLALGLTAVSLARMHEKAADALSAGRVLPVPRLAQLLVAVALTVGAAAGLAVFCSPARVRTVLGSLGPLWAVLGLLVPPLEQILFLLTQIILGSLDWLVRRVLVTFHWRLFEEALDRLTSLADLLRRSSEAGMTLPPSLLTGLRYAGVVLCIILIVGFVLLYLHKVRARRHGEELEEEALEDMTFGGNTLGRGLRWLRDTAGLVRRFGVGRHLLTAVSVQNMYANLCRLARQRGYARHPAQPPDTYLPVLSQAFPGQEEALARITTAYMRVHYGDQAVPGPELSQLRKDYDGVRSAPSQAHA
jgi:hypothetical protein